MAILAGIDEAGFGPLLGPLVVSCSTFSVAPAAGQGDASLLEADLWQVLQRSVGKTRKHLAGRLLVADSKKAFSRQQGLGHLQRTVLAALQAMGKGPPGDGGSNGRVPPSNSFDGVRSAAALEEHAQSQFERGTRPTAVGQPGVQSPESRDTCGPPTTISGLLEVLSPDCLSRLAEYPWFQNLQNCGLAVPADVRIAAQVFADDLQAHGAKLVHLRSSCLDVAYYNTMVERVKNKSQVLFIAVTQLIQCLLDRFPAEDLHILVDRQGGRTRYRENLLRSFPGGDLRIVQEGDGTSVYELRLGSRRVRLSFTVKADDLYLPVALASMVSKYLRELLMGCMNEYFVALDPGLTPTAGYWKDGTRFIEELRQRLPGLKLDAHRMIRCR